ncbi:MAG: class I SAM-dependent methyltransferase [Vicinamibacterales bacterium]
MADALANWLALREPADTAARSSALAESTARALATHHPLCVLELGTGTGANIRYLAPRLGGRQRWLAVDRDEDVLGRLPLRLSEWARERGYELERDAHSVTFRSRDFAADVETMRADLDRVDPGLLEGRHLVTASALLDLVSEEWLRSLASQCAAVKAAVLFALTYTGRSSCEPHEPEDDWIRDLLNRHQNRDKGLGGPAAGPAGADAAVQAFAAAGYETKIVSTPWQLGPEMSELQRQLVGGWAQAALEMEPGKSAAIASWESRRLAHIQAERSHIVVEHADVAARLARPVQRPEQQA